MTLKFHEFYSAKNMVRDTHKSRKPQVETEKKHLSQPETFFKKRKNREKIRNFSKNFLKKVSGKSHSAENLEQSFTLAKRFILSKN